MAASVDALPQRLEALLGSSCVSDDREVLELYAVDGLVPRVLCTPADAAQIGEIIRLCADVGAAIIPWGGGTSMALGNLPRAVDVVLSLQRLSGVVEHDDANLTATILAGTSVSAVQNVLATRGQFLPVDPPWRIRATVGGVVSAATNGPRRMAYGAVRDLVIGMHMVLGTGEAVKAGGKVVKNVAGYDLCKLFTGSLGSLGIITDLTFKLAPAPDATALVVIHGGLRDLTALADDLRESPLLPAALILCSGEVPDGGAAASLLVRVEGFGSAVARHVADTLQMAAARGLAGAAPTGGEQDAAWRRVRDFPVPDPEQVVWRLSVSLGTVGAAVARFDDLARTAPLQICADVGTGTMWLKGPSSAGQIPTVQAFAAAVGGYAVLLSAPPQLKAGMDIWGGPPPGAALMREIKRSFDPSGILNPGRFVLGL